MFLFAFDEKAKVHRRFAGRFDRLQEAEDLALVVGRAARVETTAAHRRLERRRGPLAERIGRLHIVMAVNQQGGRARHLRAYAPHDGVGFAAEEFDFGATEST